MVYINIYLRIVIATERCYFYIFYELGLRIGIGIFFKIHKGFYRLFLGILRTGSNVDFLGFLFCTIDFGFLEYFSKTISDGFFKYFFKSIKPGKFTFFNDFFNLCQDCSHGLHKYLFRRC